MREKAKVGRNKGRKGRKVEEGGKSNEQLEIGGK
jgi:hypothetical protein